MLRYLASRAYIEDNRFNNEGRKRDTDIKPFLTSKLCPKTVNSAAIKYGNVNDGTAIKSYIEYEEKKGLQLTVHKFGLQINPSIPWLAATPDSIVEIEQEMGCLEVKCPYTCKIKPIAVAALQQSSLCLESDNGVFQLKKNIRTSTKFKHNFLSLSFHGVILLYGHFDKFLPSIVPQ